MKATSSQHSLRQETSRSSRKDDSSSSGSSVRGTSSSLRGSSIRFCQRCKSSRMSSLTKDPHSLCVGCRGLDCDWHRRCIECQGWSDSVVLAYLSDRRVKKRQERYRVNKEYLGGLLHLLHPRLFRIKLLMLMMLLLMMFRPLLGRKILSPKLLP